MNAEEARRIADDLNFAKTILRELETEDTYLGDAIEDKGLDDVASRFAIRLREQCPKGKLTLTEDQIETALSKCVNDYLAEDLEQMTKEGKLKMSLDKDGVINFQTVVEEPDDERKS